MFGNKKMYKKGLADAMQAYEDFSKKQKEALDQLRAEVAQGAKRFEDGLAELSDNLNGIYELLNDQEKAALYHLNTPTDVRDLEEHEQRLLVAILHQLANDEGPALNDYQRTYIASISNYLGITNPQLEADLSVVSDIDSLESQRAIMQVVLEFLYLQDADEITDAQEDFLSNFSVNQKQYTAIHNTVIRLYNAVGAKGLSKKYGPVVKGNGKGSAGMVSPDEVAAKLKHLDYCINALSNEFTYSTYVDITDYDHSKLSVYAYDSNIKSKSRCTEQAQNQVDRLWRSADKKASVIFKKTGDDSIYATFKSYFERNVSDLKDAISDVRKLCAGCAGCAGAIEAIDGMSSLLHTSEFYTKVSQIYDNLASKHRLPSSSHYYSEITYDEYNPAEGEGGFARLIATVTYGYDAFEIKNSIVYDLRECISDYAEDFAAQWSSVAQSMFTDKLSELFVKLSDALNGLDG